MQHPRGCQERGAGVKPHVAEDKDHRAKCQQTIVHQDIQDLLKRDNREKVQHLHVIKVCGVEHVLEIPDGPVLE